jgi:hypothetical protein
MTQWFRDAAKDSPQSVKWYPGPVGRGGRAIAATRLDGQEEILD